MAFIYENSNKTRLTAGRYAVFNDGCIRYTFIIQCNINFPYQSQTFGQNVYENVV